MTEDVGFDTATVESQLVGVSGEVAAARPVDESRTPFELPPIDGADLPAPQRHYFPDVCPNDKRQRADWAELEASKRAKEREQAESPEEAEAMAALIEELTARKVPAEVVLKQQEFYATVAARQRELDALPDVERAQAVADLKEAMLGGGVDEQLQ